MHDDTGPYSQAHAAYAAAGWRGVLPVGRAPAQKTPPPLGWTGHAAGETWPSAADRHAWAEGPEGARNIALRLPDGVLGLDVDAYGAKVGAASLAALVEAYGPLPHTWVTSARDDGVSGIRLYRVPRGLHWPGEAGDNIEIVQVGHRYALVWPSVNPDAAGAVYRWRLSDFADAPAPGEVAIPSPEDLPELPVAWVAGLARPWDRTEPLALDDGGMRGWLEACRAAGSRDDVCPPVLREADAAARALIEGRARSRHELTRDAVRALVGYGGEGHVGAAQMLVVVRDAFVAAVEGDKGRDAAAEWFRLLAGGIRLAARDNPDPRQACDCALRAGEGVSFSEDFTGGGVVNAVGERGEHGEQPARTSLRDRLLVRSDLHKLPKPEPLIRGVLNVNSDAWLIGASGSYKSFVAIDWACRVATGLPWNGAEVKRGPVLYVAAEGASGIEQRITAWEKEHVAVGDDLLVLPVAVQALGREAGQLGLTAAWWELREIATQVRPALIVLDTQARMSLGARENDNSEMGMWVEAVSWLRSQCDACVLVVHHTGRNGGDARGASAIDGAQDIEWKVERTGTREEQRAKLRLDKSKDSRDGVEYALWMRSVDVGVDSHGQPVTSLVVTVDPAGVRSGAVIRDAEVNLGENRQEVLAALREVAMPEGDTQAQLIAKVNERRKERARQHGRPYEPISKSSMSTALVGRKDRPLPGLVDLGLAVRNGAKFADPDRFAAWLAEQEE